MEQTEKINVEHFTELLAKFIALLVIRLPDDVMAKLAELSQRETSPLGRVLYEAIKDDLSLAAQLKRPLCQDTGILQFTVRVGSNFPWRNKVSEVLRQAVLRATREVPLRPNAVEIFTHVNSGNNTGTRIPWIDWEVIPDCDDIYIYGYVAGGGCSLPGTAKVFMPLEGLEGVVRYIFDQITSYGINACPPLLVGVGLAGSMDVAAKLSKTALLRPIGTSNPDAATADLEQRLTDGLNALGIGPGGLGGEASVLGVHVEQAARHPATLAAAISTGCWALRRALIRLDADLNYEVLSHKGAVL